MNLQQLNDNFAIPGVLSFHETEHGLLRANVTSSTCTAEIYLQGAHLSQWHPVGHSPVLFLSEKSGFQKGKAIRGGIPIIFPWFGARTETSVSSRTDGPSHGFARTSKWKVLSATADGDFVQISLSLEPSDTSKSFGYDNFFVTYKITAGVHLGLEITVENRAKTSFVFEEALHTYLLVDDVSAVGIKGLVDTDYIDKTDSFKRKRETESVLSLTGETDRPYLNSSAPVELNDPILKRTITVEKENSQTTVIWNPWSEVTAKLADMSPDGWQRMTCIETANVAENRITLPPGQKHTMSAKIVVKELS